MLICVHCRAGLRSESADKYSCTSCGAVFRRDQYGFFGMLKEQSEIDSTLEDYAEEQHHCGAVVAERYLRGLLNPELRPRILDVGCGVGRSVTALLEAGFDAYGIDLPNLAPFWAAARNPPDRFIEASAARLPFPDNSFDFVYSFGVIEHVGTVNGFGTLAEDYRAQRAEYAREMLRVVKPEGRIVVACPNKSFPIDIQHGPSDTLYQAGRLRSWIFAKTGMNVHQTWGRYHLVSYAEIRELFANGNGGRRITALPLRNYFQFGRFNGGFLRPLRSIAELWINHMPERARRSFLNPYVMAEIRK